MAKIKYEELINNARTAFSMKNYEGCLKFCQQAIEMYPEKADTYDLLTYSLIVLGKPEQAESFVEYAIQLEPRKGAHYFVKGNMLIAERKVDEALAAYAKASMYKLSDEECRIMYFNMGEISKNQGDYEAAIINYDKCSAISGFNKYRKEILLSKIEIYNAQEKYELALTTAIALKLLRPDNFKTYHLISQLFLKLDNLEGSINNLDEALTVFEKNRDMVIEVLFDKVAVYCNAAVLWPKDKITHFNSALKTLVEVSAHPQLQEKDRYEVLLTMADIYRELNEMDRMISCCERVVDKEGEMFREYYEKARYRIIGGYIFQKKYQKARKYAAMLKGCDNMLYSTYGYYMEAFTTAKIAESAPDMMAQARTLYQTAIAYYKKCMASSVGDFFALAYRIQACADLGLKDEATKLCEWILNEDSRAQMKKYIENPMVQVK